MQTKLNEEGKPHTAVVVNVEADTTAPEAFQFYSRLRVRLREIERWIDAHELAEEEDQNNG